MNQKFHGTLINVKGAQNSAIVSIYNKFKFNEKTNLEAFIKKWDELTHYHYEFYSRKEISYIEQRRRRIIDLFREWNIELIEDNALIIYDIYLKEFENNWFLFGDVKDTLEQIKKAGYIIGAISNGDFSQQTQKLEKTGIRDFFTYIDTSREMPFSKPDSRVFETVLKKYNIAYNEFLLHRR